MPAFPVKQFVLLSSSSFALLSFNSKSVRRVQIIAQVPIKQVCRCLLLLFLPHYQLATRFPQKREGGFFASIFELDTKI